MVQDLMDVRSLMGLQQNRNHSRMLPIRLVQIDRVIVAGALRTQHNPASQCLHRSSVSRIRNAAARGAASCEQSFFWKRSTDGGDRLRSGGAYDSRTARQRGQESDTQFTDRNNATVYSVL